jgi:hypothetical protein
MRDSGVRPDCESLVSCLRSVAQLAARQAGQYGPACLLSLALLAEFRVAGVEASLGAYKLLIDIFHPKGKKSTILHDVLRYEVKKPDGGKCSGEE